MPRFEITEEDYGEKIKRQRLLQRGGGLAPSQGMGAPASPEIDMEEIKLPPIPEGRMREAETPREVPEGSSVMEQLQYISPELAESLLQATRWTAMAMKAGASYETQQLARLMQEIHRARVNGGFPFAEEGETEEEETEEETEEEE